MLALDEVLALHEDQVHRYGGSSSLREPDLLSSALGAVSATFGVRFLHQSLFEMAAAYLFYVAQNHPFVDGNKRTALASALTFLWMNDVEVEAGGEALASLVLGVADGQISKAEIAVFLQDHAQTSGADRGE